MCLDYVDCANVFPILPVVILTCIEDRDVMQRAFLTANSTNYYSNSRKLATFVAGFCFLPLSIIDVILLR